MEESPALYLHIPFCRKKCDYCDFFSRGGSRSVPDGYVQALLAEAAFYAERLQVLGLFDLTIYDGEGLPLQPETPVTVRVSFDSALTADMKLYAVHFPGTGAAAEQPETVEATAVEPETVEPAEAQAPAENESPVENSHNNSGNSNGSSNNGSGGNSRKKNRKKKK